MGEGPTTRRSPTGGFRAAGALSPGLSAAAPSDDAAPLPASADVTALSWEPADSAAATPVSPASVLDAAVGPLVA